MLSYQKWKEMQRKLEELNYRLANFYNTLQFCQDDQMRETYKTHILRTRNQIWVLHKQIYKYNIGEKVIANEIEEIGEIIHREINPSLPLDKRVQYVVKNVSGREFMTCEGSLTPLKAK